MACLIVRPENRLTGRGQNEFNIFVAKNQNSLRLWSRGRWPSRAVRCSRPNVGKGDFLPNEPRKCHANGTALSGCVEPCLGSCHVGEGGRGLKRGAERFVYRQTTHDGARPLGVTPG